jgi:hypothetical protein
MMVPNVPTVDNMITSFPRLTLPRVSAEGNYNVLVELRNRMKANFCSIYTISGGSNYGHLGDLLTNTMYATIAPNNPYVVPRNAGPQPSIEADITLINKENLLWAYAELKRENIEYKNRVDNDAVLMSDRQFIQTILNALTDEYGNLIENVEDKIDESTAFAIEDLKEKLAAKAYDPDVSGMKGKITRTKPTTVESNTEEIPDELLEI